MEIIKAQTTKPTIPTDWDYSKSVNQVKALVFKWKNLTGDILQELWVARKVLSIAHRPSESGKKFPLKTWNRYCQDIGIEKRTANIWLSKWLTSETKAPLGKQLITTGCFVKDLNELIGKGLKFGTIYADPPWQYSNQATRSATDGVYSSMSLNDIADLPIADLSSDQAHLHLWTTNAFLFDAKQIIEAWGFEYKSCFVWVKPQLGIGNYWRVSHEFLLLGIRGGLRFEDKSQISWKSEDRTGHSQKPESVRTILEKVSPPPYLELFGRRLVDGWIVWGNEIEHDLFSAQRI